MASAAATAAAAKSRAAADAKSADAGGKPGVGETSDPMAFANALGGMAEAALAKFFAGKKV